MPDPPGVSPITYYLFDNPWPLAVLLLVLAVAMLVAVRQSGRREYIIVSGAAVVFAVCVFVIESLVTTSGERAEQVTRELVDAAEQADVGRARSLFADDAIMSLVNPRNPGVGIDTIRRRIEMLDDRYRIESNRITMLDSYSAEAERGVVHLRVTTDFEAGMGYATPSAWVIEVRKQADGSWKISHLTFVEYNLGQKPTVSLF